MPRSNLCSVYLQYIFILSMIADRWMTVTSVRVNEFEDILQHMSSEAIEVYNSDIYVSVGYYTWFEAFDVCALHHRIFAFPLSQKAMRLASFMLDTRLTWVELYKMKWGWIGQHGSRGLHFDWEDPKDADAPEGSCAAMNNKMEFLSRNCTELLNVLCLNPTLHDSHRIGYPDT
ncbi:hypothetical protein EG68_06970 [Paragonimus skrjabini miyazakii]|uniref:C-type lectin domain-containing protein n=1 Tax=Paragonimus skrjabini miyazakii TaxID=59628 RepID=A0A8S9YM06_9TREM|nr:hypothetical protein EG68_06970 [Paragonimus skrjabini miyazakii]